MTQLSRSLALRPPTMLALAALLLGAAPSQANLVANGSFETTPVTITTQFGNASVASWAGGNLGGEALVTPNWFTNGYLFPPNVGIAGPFPQSSPDGGNFVFSDGNYLNSAITQTLTGLTPGNTYVLSFYQALAQDTEPFVTIPGPVTGRWMVSFGSGTQFGASMVGDGSTLTFSPWKLQTMNFVANNSSEVLSFLSIGTGDPPLLMLDGVNVVAVPEPETLGLLGLGGLLLAMKFRAESRAARR